MKRAYLNTNGQKIDNRRLRARARHEFARVIGEGIGGLQPTIVRDCDSEKVPAEMIITDSTPQPDKIILSGNGEVRIDGVPSDPNANRKECRKRRRVRHSIVDGKWKYASVFVYELEGDAGARWLGETTLGESLDRRDTLGAEKRIASIPLSDFESAIAEQLSWVRSGFERDVPELADLAICAKRLSECLESGMGCNRLADEFGISRAQSRAVIKLHESIPN